MKTVLAVLIGLGALAAAGRAQDASPAAAPAPSAQPQQDACLEAVGGLSASHTYTTYMYVGVTADMLAVKGYEAEQVVTMMNEVTSLCQNAHRLVDKLQDGKLNEGDRRYLDEIQEIYQLLKSEAETLATFAKSGKPEDKGAYEAARKSVLPKIQKLLGHDAGPSPAAPPASPTASPGN